MTGGASCNNSNLLGRNREIEELEELISKSEQKIRESRNRLEDIKTAQSLLVDDIEANNGRTTGAADFTEYGKNECGSCSGAEERK